MATIAFESHREGLVKDIAPLMESLQIIEDPRLDRRKRHPLINILVMTLVSLASGAYSWSQVVEFVRLNLSWFARYLDMTNGVPSHDTFARVLSLLDPKAVEKILQSWLSKRSRAEKKGRQICFDGKALRGASHWQEEGEVVHLVNAYCPEEGISLAQTTVDNKENEITAVPKLIDQLSLKGAVCSGDAMYTQASIAKSLRKAEADYCLALKDNQKKFRKDVEAHFGAHFPSTQVEMFTEKNKGRIEEREVSVSHQIQRINGYQKWEGLKSIIRIKSRRGEGADVEIRYFICSIKLSPSQALSLTRTHWQIENNHHRMLDVYFHEDKWQNRMKIAATNLAVLRRLAGSIMFKLNPGKAMIHKMMAMACSSEFRDRFINLEF